MMKNYVRTALRSIKKTRAFIANPVQSLKNE
jgi:hypothetical protein